MKTINEIKAAKSFAGPGEWAIDAEATVFDTETGKELYVHVNDYDMFRHYTVSETSIYEFMTGDGDDPGAVFTEEYGKFSDAKGSEYYKVFDTLNKVITRLAKGLA